MALTRTRIHNPAQIAAAVASILTCPASTKLYVKGILLHNTNSTTETVEIYLVPNSGGSLGTAAAANRIIRVALAADETQFFEMPATLVLDATNDSIQAVTTTAAKVTVVLTGEKDA